MTIKYIVKNCIGTTVSEHRTERAAVEAARKAATEETAVFYVSRSGTETSSSQHR